MGVCNVLMPCQESRWMMITSFYNSQANLCKIGTQTLQIQEPLPQPTYPSNIYEQIYCLKFNVSRRSWRRAMF